MRRGRGLWARTKADGGMAYPTKIATCCHCGTRAALTLERGRHELSCASCGAPLHDLKALPVKPAAPRPAVSHQRPVRSFPAGPGGKKTKKAKPPRKSKKVKKRKSLLSRVAEEVFDLVEDIFD